MGAKSSPEVVMLMGCPRSGTTLLLDLLAAHEEFAWVSQTLRNHPRHTCLSFLQRIYDIDPLFQICYPAKESLPPRVCGIPNLLPYPVEPLWFWSYYLHGFSGQDESGARKNPGPSDVSQPEMENLQKAVQRLCRYSGKSAFLTKYTDLSRMEFFSKIFPQARFVHISREPEAVAYSQAMLRQKGIWSNNREVLDSWAASWPLAWQALWRQQGASNLLHGVFQWKFFTDMIRGEKEKIQPDRVLEIRYTDLVNHPTRIINQVLTFAGRRISQRVENYVLKKDISNMDLKWKQALSREEKQSLQEVLCRLESQEF